MYFFSSFDHYKPRYKKKVAHINVHPAFFVIFSSIFKSVVLLQMYLTSKPNDLVSYEAVKLKNMPGGSVCTCIYSSFHYSKPR